MSGSRFALIALVAANLVPLVGVVALGWSLFDVMIVYWFENVVVGLYALLKVVTSRADAGEGLQGSKLFVAPFFIVHYGLFLLVHGAFVVLLFGDSRSVGAALESLVSVPGGSITELLAAAGGLGFAVLSMIVSHGVSFVTDYLGKGEFRRLPPTVLMFQPYGRVVVLHLTVLVGAFAIQLLGAPVLALLLLVALKIGIDVRAHLNERSAASSGRRGRSGVTPR